MSRVNRRIPTLPGALLIALTCSCLLADSGSAADDDPFQLFTRPSQGRTLAAEIADLNGDGRGDLLQFVSIDRPPREKRLLRAFLQDSEGALPAVPSFEHPLPPGAAAYDVADLDSRPGVELVFLHRRGVTIAHPSGVDIPWDEFPIEPATVGAGADERGLERLAMVFESDSEPTWIAVPGFSGPVVLGSKGQVIGQLESPGRANYFIPQLHGMAFLESDVQLYFDAPHLSIGDVNGDGRRDLVSATRHALRIFLQAPNGKLPSTASETILLDLISEREHMRGTGGVVGEAADIDGDGRLDLLLSQVSGTLTNSTAETHIYMNREGTWDLSSPDRSYATKGAIGSNSLMDLDGDGLPELVRASIKVSVLELVEVLITRELDVEVSLFANSPNESSGAFAADASSKLKIEIPLSFESFRPTGFLPNLKTDLDGDGYRDLLRSGAGDEISVYSGEQAGERKTSFKKRVGRQKVDTRGQLALGDWNGDNLPDLLIFDPKNPEVPLRLLINRLTNRSKPARR
jgi:hypothetical protein